MKFPFFSYSWRWISWCGNNFNYIIVRVNCKILTNFLKIWYQTLIMNYSWNDWKSHFRIGLILMWFLKDLFFSCVFFVDEIQVPRTYYFHTRISKNLSYMIPFWKKFYTYLTIFVLGNFIPNVFVFLKKRNKRNLFHKNQYVFT